jgi:hypothetical protein
MSTIPNHVNSNFQIAHFLIGACHTPDGAYAVLCGLREGREMALAQVKASDIRTKAKEIRAKQKLSSGDEAERLEAEADLEEINSNKKFALRNIEAAKTELDFIELCITTLNPFRKYAELPDEEAHQKSQHEEWRLELIRRAENYLLTSGSIPAEHYGAMRLHPDYIAVISPCIQAMLTTIAQSGGREQLLHTVALPDVNNPLVLIGKNDAIRISSK